MEVLKTMHTRKWGIVVIAVVLLSLALAACGGDDDADTFTVGIINPSSGLVAVVEGFKAGMTENDYVEGENVTYIDEGVLAEDRREAAIQQMVDDGVDLIVTMGTPMSIMAQGKTDSIPILFMPITDPVGAGLVESIAQPGGNLTGISVAGQDLPRLDRLVKLVPEVQTVYVAYNPDDPAPTSILPDMRQTAEGLGVTLIEVEAPDVAAMDAAAREVPDDADAILIMPDSLAIASLPVFRETALARNLPLASIPLFGADLGVLLTYGFDPFDVGQSSARLADIILKGGDPAEIPVETADFFLTVNMATADAIGITFTEEQLRIADEVIYE